MLNPKTLWFNHSISSLDVILSAIRSNPDLANCRIIVSNKFEASNLIQLCDLYQVEPKFNTTAKYVDWCTRFARDHNVDIFFPQRAADQITLAIDQFREIGAEVVMPAGLDEPQMIDSKSWVYKGMEEAGMGALLPQAWSVAESVDQIRALLSVHSQTLCLKPDKGIYGEGFFVLKAGTGLSLTQAPPWVGVDTLADVFPYLYEGLPCIVTEFLPGHEYSIDCAFRHGELLGAVVRRKSSIKHQHLFTIADQQDPVASQLFESAGDIGSLLNLNGWSNIQFMEDSAGVPRFLEVNPRFSGGIGMAAVANPMLPLIPIFSALGLWEDGMNSYQNNGEAVVSSTKYTLLNCPEYETNTVLQPE